MGLKLREICANRAVAVIAYLLRQSDVVGGGDIKNMQEYPNAGRWAGNRVIVVGEGDKSGLYQKAMHSIPNGETYTDISMVIRREFEKLVEEPLDERWGQKRLKLKININYVIAVVRIKGTKRFHF
jgi:hypothetical protein